MSGGKSRRMALLELEEAADELHACEEALRDA